MGWKEQYKSFLWILGFFLFAYFIPIEDESFSVAIIAIFDLAKWYAQEYVLLCLIPAFFIAGVIAVFVSQNAVIKYLGGGVLVAGFLLGSADNGNGIIPNEWIANLFGVIPYSRISLPLL